MRRVSCLMLLLAVIAATAGPGAQHQLVPVAALRGKPALEVMLRKLDTVGSFMMTTAHPDDENNAMLGYYAHGKGFRSTLVTATRGEGGQNEIGPELFEALAVLRTEELLAAHRFDGAEQYFTRAVDFGYSFSIDETLDKWGEQEILGDYVRMIRTIRPDVIVGFVFDGDGGGQHHQTSSRLTLAAFRAAGDPDRFPEQIRNDGLRPWQPKKFYSTAGFFGGPAGRPGQARTLPGDGAPTLLTFNGGDEFDPVLGRTYAEIGGEARSMHKCQGMSQLLLLPGGSGGPMGFGGGPRAYRLRDTVLPDGVTRLDRDPFDGVETGLASLAAYAGSRAPAELQAALSRIGAIVVEARTALAASGPAAAAQLLAQGVAAVRELRARLGSMGLTDDARYEIDFRLKQKEEQFAQALVLAAEVRVEAIANDGLVVPGQDVGVQLIAATRSAVPVVVKSRTLHGFADPTPQGGRIPIDARPTAAHFKYAADAARFVVDADVAPGLPFRPTPYTASFELTVSGADVKVSVPVQFRSERNIFSGEKRAELHVVPKFAVSASPAIAVIGDGDATRPPSPATPVTVSGGEREVRVTVTNHSKGGAHATVALDLPSGWRARPDSAAVSFSREDEATTVRFILSAPPPPMLKGGSVVVKARVWEGATHYDQGYQLVEYPHTTRRHVLRAPEVTVKAVDVKVKPDLTVGYVMGVGDEIVPALEQIGARVALIDADELAWGDLGRYDVIMTGVRAYERREDLRAYNHRLIDYARSGGTVIVHYNKVEFNDAQYGPYPAKVGRDRVSDEHAPVRLLAPQHPVFHMPNRIGADDWQGWVQERGLYFLDTADRDPRYADLLEFDEPFPFNKGAKRGALVEAKVGEGRWIYLGMNLWRQLPAGTEGAYRLMANLVSLGNAPNPSSASPPGRR
jgi:LmbE family N-acetylglucosaminyl deacetylase